jgi:predicted acyltransferase
MASAPLSAGGNDALLPLAMADERPSAGDAAARAPAGTRLMSLDALRGFDMFWILGADGFVRALGKISDRGPVQLLAGQLSHKSWEGFSFYDLIFPLFVFIVGVSVVLSLARQKEQGLTGKTVRRILVRGFWLFVLGIVFSGGIRAGWSGVRLVGVLQRIALCYTATALLFLALRPRGLAIVCGALLIGYWALLTFVPIRDISLEKESLAALQKSTGAESPRALYDATTTTVTDSYAPGRNLTNHLDFKLLPGRKYDGQYDPEGLLSTLPAIATCLLGVFAGLLLLRKDLPDARKVRLLLGCGAAAVILGFAWGMQFPVIKKIWTSSYVLVAAGWSALLLAAFFQVIEVWGKRRWALPLLWIGMNPIAIYLARNFFDFGALAERLVGGPIKDGLGAYGPLLVTLVSMALSIALVRFMYQRKIFLRL